jgi:hypothetical protein
MERESVIRSRTFLVALAVAVPLFLGSCPDSAIPSSVHASDGTNAVDMGRVAPGETVERTFILRSRSAVPRKLQRIVSDCSCLQAFSKAVAIAPDQEYELRVVLRAPTLVPTLEADKTYRLSLLFEAAHRELIDVSFTVEVPPVISPPNSTALRDPATGAFSASSMLLLPSWLSSAKVSLASSPGVQVELGAQEDGGRYWLSASGQVDDPTDTPTFLVETRVDGWDAPLAWTIAVSSLNELNLRAVPSTLVVLPGARTEIALCGTPSSGSVAWVEPEGACQVAIPRGGKIVSVSEVSTDIEVFEIISESSNGGLRIPCYVIPHAP